jgi:hypothetical protein
MPRLPANPSGSRARPQIAINDASASTLTCAGRVPALTIVAMIVAVHMTRSHALTANMGAGMRQR